MIVMENHMDSYSTSQCYNQASNEDNQLFIELEKKIKRKIFQIQYLSIIINISLISFDTNGDI